MNKSIMDQTKQLYKEYLKTVKGDVYPEDGPITSSAQKQIIESLLDTKDYVVIRSNDIVHTLGLWLLYGIPELIIHKDIMVNDIINEYVRCMTGDGTKNYDYQDMNIQIFKTDVQLSIVPEDHYFGSKMTNLLWFYTYYMEADKIDNLVMPSEGAEYIEKMDGLEFKLWPVYEIKTESIDSLSQIQSAINSSINLNYDEFSESDHKEYSELD